MRTLAILLFCLLICYAKIPVYCFLLLIPAWIMMIIGPKLEHIITIDSMDGIQFEHYTAMLFEKMGYKAAVTPANGDFGADVVISRGKEKTCIQCKRYAGKVGIEAVQQVIGSIKHYGASSGMVVTNSSYTEAAQALAMSNGIKLIDGAELKRLQKKYGS